MNRPANHKSLPRRTSQDTTADVQRVLAKLEPTGQDLTILRLLANSSHAFRPFVLFSGALLNRATLPAPVREAVILAMAVADGTSYEWAEHVPMATEAGLSAEQIEAIRVGDLASLPEELLFGIETATQVRAGIGVSEADWQRMVTSWTQEGALDLVLTAGWWGGMIPAVINALGLTGDDVGAP